jgi:hypothetical protein
VPLAPIERRRRSRAALENRVISAVFLGDGLATIARRPHMPRLMTLKRWIERDAAFHDRYETARDDSRYILADDMMALAKEALAKARTARQRTAALRMRLDLLKWWAKAFGDTARKSDSDEALDEQMIAILNKGLEKGGAAALATTDHGADA